METPKDGVRARTSLYRAALTVVSTPRDVTDFPLSGHTSLLSSVRPPGGLRGRATFRCLSIVLLIAAIWLLVATPWRYTGFWGIVLVELLFVAVGYVASVVTSFAITVFLLKLGW